MNRRNVILAAALALLLPTLTDAAEWRELSPATSPSARAGHTLVAVGDTAYLYGGTGASYTPMGDLWRFDSTAETWVEVQSSTPPGARFYHNAVVVGDRLLVGFGYGPSGTLSDLWVFDPATGQWTELLISPAVPGRSIGMMAAVDDDTIFVGGGYGGDGMQVLTDAWLIQLSPAGKGPTATATQLAPIPSAIYGGAAAALGGRPALIGGWRQTKQPVEDIFLYDFDSSTWQQVTPSGQPVLARALPAVAHWRGPGKAWGDIVLILGGETDEKAAASASTQVYDLATNTWSYDPCMPVALSSQAAAALPPAAKSGRVEVVVFGGVGLDGTRLDRTFLLTTDIPASAVTTHYVPASAHVTGVNAFWVTDLQLHNRGATDLTGTLAMLLRDQANPSPTTTPVEVPAGHSVRLADVLSLFGVTNGAAALRLDVEGGELLVTSRTFNQTDDGTYGQFIPGQMESEAVSFGQLARLPQLSRSADPSTGFRTNIGFVNVTDSPIEVEVDLYAADGSLVGIVEQGLQAFEYRQITDIFGRVTTGDVADGFAAVRTTTTGGRFFTYASVVDNVTADPVYIRPQRAMGADGGCITATAHAGGIGGTVWRSDLQLYNSGLLPATCTVSLLARDQANPNPASTPLTVAGSQSVRYEDVLDTLFEFTGTASLLFERGSGDLMVTSRTFNQGPDGTYGQFIPLAGLDDATRHGDEVRLIQLSRSADPSTGFRTNVGFVNLTDGTTTVEVALFAADGSPLGTVTQELRDFEYRQLTDVFNLVGGGDVDDGFAVVRTTTSGGKFLAYASVVDNQTGDPVYIPGM